MYGSARDEAFRLRKFLSVQADNLSSRHLYESKRLIDKCNGLSRRLNETIVLKQIRYAEVSWFADTAREVLGEAGCKHRDCKRVMRELSELSSALESIVDWETDGIGTRY